MKKAPILFVLLLLVFTSCSKEEDIINESSANYIIQETTKAPPIRITLKNDSYLDVRAMLKNNGTANGSWRDNFGGRGSIDCVNLYALDQGTLIIITGTSSTGAPKMLTLIDDGVDGDQRTDLFDGSGMDCQAWEAIILMGLENQFIPLTNTDGQITIQ